MLQKTCVYIRNHVFLFTLHVGSLIMKKEFLAATDNQEVVKMLKNLTAKICKLNNSEHILMIYNSFRSSVEWAGNYRQCAVVSI